MSFKKLFILLTIGLILSTYGADKNESKQFFALRGTSTKGDIYTSIIISLERNIFSFYSQLTFYSSPFEEKNGIIYLKNTPKGYSDKYYIDNENGQKILKLPRKSSWIFIPSYSKYYPISEEKALEQIKKWEDIRKERSRGEIGAIQ